MSSKIGISKDEILASIKALPPVAAPMPGSDALSVILASMKARRKEAALPRVIFYRYDDAPTDEADQFQAALQAGNLPLHGVCAELDCDLQLIELGEGSSDETENARATAFGMMAAEQSTGLIVGVGFGAGSEARTSKIDPHRFFETATPEISVLLGVMVAGVRAGIPVIAEGSQGLAAARALQTIRADLTHAVFICGVTERDQSLHIFADVEKSDTGYAGVVLAALAESEFAKQAA